MTRGMAHVTPSRTRLTRLRVVGWEPLHVAGGAACPTKRGSLRIHAHPYGRSIRPTCRRPTPETQAVLLAAVDVDLPAVGEHHVLEPDDLLAVGELIPGACDYVALLDRCPGPAIGLHSIER